LHANFRAAVKVIILDLLSTRFVPVVILSGTMTGSSCGQIPIPIKFTAVLCYWFGLRIFRHDKKCRYICNILAICYYISIVVGLARTVFVVATYPSKTEDAISLLIFLVGALIVYVFMRKNISQIEQVFRGIESNLTEKDLIKIKQTDKWINIMHHLCLLLSTIIAVWYFFCERNEIGRLMNSWGMQYSETTVVILTTIAYCYYMKVLYGIIACSIQLYTITMVVFNCIGQNLMTLIKQSLIDGELLSDQYS
jgi:hypothetical protein